MFDTELPKTLGVRECLGLPDIGFDNLSPAIISGFTGKRNTTSILNSSVGQKSWGIWKYGPTVFRQIGIKLRHLLQKKNGHFRLSVQDIALIQGFPESRKFAGAVYQVLG